MGNILSIGGFILTILGMVMMILALLFGGVSS